MGLGGDLFWLGGDGWGLVGNFLPPWASVGVGGDCYVLTMFSCQPLNILRDMDFGPHPENITKIPKYVSCTKYFDILIILMVIHYQNIKILAFSRLTNISYGSL